MSKIRRQQAIILERETLLQGFFHVELLKLQHTLQGGELSPAIDRLVLQRPDAVCAVVVHQERQSLFFVRQFRTGVFEKDHGWLIELAAGLVDEGETPEQAVKREIMEELGFAPHRVEFLQKIYTSPAIISERIFIYYIEVDSSMRVGPGGGMDSEHEDLEIIEVPIDNLDVFVKENTLTDAKTLLGLHFAQDRLRI